MIMLTSYKCKSRWSYEQHLF